MLLTNQIKLQTLKSRLELYYTAEQKILEGQAYSIGSRSLTRANLSEVKASIAELEGQINALETRGTTRRKVARIIPKDF